MVARKKAQMTPREPRMSEERLEEIRRLRANDRDQCHWGHVTELLNEIDALRAELDNSRQTRLAIKLTRTEEERDALRAELVSYKDMAKRNGDSAVEWSKKTNALRAENEALKRIAEAAKEGAWRTVFEHQPRDTPGPSSICKLALFLDDPDAFRDALAAWEDRG